MPFEDKTIVCEECGQEFVHSAEDQERYAGRGFTNDPKRCRECREKRKTEGVEAGGKLLVCADCNQEFLFSGKDQAYYAERGFTNDPKRCRECREKRKDRARASRGGPGDRGGGRFGGAGGGRDRSGPGGGRPQRPSYEAVCAECGCRTTLPFKPVQGRAVYCRDCYRKQRR